MSGSGRQAAGSRPAGPIYVYAIADALPGRLPRRGMADEPVIGLKEGTLSVIAGELDLLPPFSLARLRRQHALVERAAASVSALLPVRYGTLLAGRVELRDLLRRRAPALRQGLDLVRGRCQMTLRLTHPDSREAGPGRRTRPGTPARARQGPGAAYLARLVRDHRATPQVPELDPVHSELDRIVHATRVTRDHRSAVAASVYHLIDRRDQAAYRRALRARPLSCRLVVSGPFPAYAFTPELT